MPAPITTPALTRSLPRLITWALLSTNSLWAQSLVSLPAVDGQVDSLAAFGNTLYIGGSFGTVGGQTRSGVAAIDLSTGTVTSWNPTFTNFGDPASIKSVAVSGDGSTVYVGGGFDNVSGQTRTNVAAVSSSGTVLPFAPNLDANVAAVHVRDNTVYVIGDFTTANSTTRLGFASFTSAGAGTLTAFDPMQSSFNAGAGYRGAAFSADGTRLYVATGNSSYNYIDTEGATVSRRGFASLQTSDGRETTPRPEVMEGEFAAGTFAVNVQGNQLYIGGAFDAANGSPAERLLAYTGDTPNASFTPATGEGPNGSVRAIGSDGGAVYLIGSFTSIGGTTIQGLAALDPATGNPLSGWDPQSSTTFGNADTKLLVHGGKVFIAGSSLGNAFNLLGQSVQYYAALTAVTAIPEPSAYATLLGGSLLAWVLWQRTRRARPR